MVQTAKVIGITDHLAEIEVSRKAMCDGCHKMQCSGKCAMSGLMSSGEKMTSFAVNKVGAKIGDTVEIETSDKEVLGTAALVFLLPLITGFAFYSLAVFLKFTMSIAVAAAVVGFVSVFLFLNLLEKKIRQREPKLTVTRILYDDADVQSDDD